MKPAQSRTVRTRIKICGITVPEHAALAGHLGVDAIGLVFYERSPRAVSPTRAKAILRATPPFVTTVGLFLDAPAALVDAVLGEVPLDLLQFHGDECPDECRRHGRPYIKALPMTPGTDVAAYALTYADAQGLLIDSHAAGQAGGTGEAFDWALWPRESAVPLILAGGLAPGNVAPAVRATRPWGVDVSSGVESRKGIKDPDKMMAFCNEVRKADGD